MGYNRSGTRRTQRMKRAKKHYERLAAKAANASDHETGSGIVGAVKKAAAGVAHAVGAAVHAVADTVKGKKEAPETPKA